MLKCLGTPGVGKTAFGSIFKSLAEIENFNVVSLSTDDFYLPFKERKALQQEDPRYLQRGPPGTVDLELLKKVIYDVKSDKREIEVPHFDKSAENGFGERTRFDKVQGKVDFFILEGWFTGCRSQEVNNDFVRRLEQIIKDPKRVDFALLQNNLLKNFEKVWQYFDHQMILTPINYRYMFDYRLEAEHKLIKMKGSGLNDDQIYNLMEYFYFSLCPEIYVSQIIDDRQAEITACFSRERDIVKTYSTIEI
ncbi:P-loop containing nucleoside triphosphate hydrolase [Pseudocohnilembus persalinus]|uniref:p-loop containing nucleoside triphosphate hydrolase n=1 Tax=Pseudocohnilembus persalinus TaxID=266149 RepID=A0A0V0QH90_PSEPJ|nr:P-loop containing nucleoside triphosphate hydrolase [Pseudocohnilembus persalinus]|eukprot:KRX01528.1 P-loop containing nucleoside triphosphate hydrolase [Pseudocohnilembus persalinus]